MNRFSSRNLLLSFLTICFLGAEHLALSQNVGLYFEEGKNKTSFPIEVCNNLIVIPVLFGDQELNFILDTGVRSTILIDKDFATSNGIGIQRKIELYGAGSSKPVNALVTEEIPLTIPGVKSGGLSTVVLEEDFLNLEQHLGTKIHGLIGYDIFSRFIVKVNYYHEKVIIFQPDEFNPKRNYFEVDLDIKESKPMVNLELELNNQKSFNSKLLVDTGASHAIVLNQQSSPEIDIPDKHIAASLGWGLSGEIKGYLGRIDCINFGEKKLGGVITSFPIADENDVSQYDRHGSIGGELLRKFHVIFDFPNSNLYLKANRSFKYPFEYNMSGLEFLAQGKDLNRYVISRIRKNAAADNVGFEPGDIVVSLNNVLSEKLDLTKIYTQLNDKEGKKINLTVYRDGQYISRSFLLRREI